MGHTTRDCKEPKRCHLCDSEAHIARDYTKLRLYAAVVKAGFVGSRSCMKRREKGDPTRRKRNCSKGRNPSSVGKLLENHGGRQKNREERWAQASSLKMATKVTREIDRGGSWKCGRVRVEGNTN